MHYILMEETNKGEYHSLDLSIWERVTQTKGQDKGNDPAVNAQGYVYVGKSYTGRQLRIFAMKEEENDADKTRD